MSVFHRPTAQGSEWVAESQRLCASAFQSGTNDLVSSWRAVHPCQQWKLGNTASAIRKVNSGSSRASQIGWPEWRSEQKASHLPLPWPLYWVAIRTLPTLRVGLPVSLIAIRIVLQVRLPAQVILICAKPTITVTQFLQRNLAKAIIAVDIQPVSKGLVWGKRNVEARRTG